jgi:hypothetical protein
LQKEQITGNKKQTNKIKNKNKLIIEKLNQDRQLASYITGGKEICLNSEKKKVTKIFLMALKYLSLIQYPITKLLIFRPQRIAQSAGDHAT